MLEEWGISINGLNGKRVRVYPYQQAENMEQVESNEPKTAKTYELLDFSITNIMV